MPINARTSQGFSQGLQGLGNRPSLLSHIYDRRLQREQEDRANLTAQAEADYKNALAQKTRAEDAQKELMVGVHAKAPKVDPNASSGDIVKQWRAAYMYYTNLGMIDEAKKMSDATKDLIASGGGGTGTQQEEMNLAGAYKDTAQGDLARANTEYVKQLKAPAPPAPQGADLLALEKWIDEKEGMRTDGSFKNLWGLLSEDLYDIDILYAQARAKMDQMAPTGPISIIDAAEMVIQEMGEQGQSPGLPSQGGVDASPQVPGLPAGWSAVP